MAHKISTFFALAVAALALPQNAMAQVTGVDPQGSGPIVNALGWMQ